MMLKKLKARLAKARSMISIKTYKRPMLFIIMTMVLLNLLILVLAAFIALAIDDDFTSFLDAFANGSLKWMMSPNSIVLIENPQTLILAVVVLVTGMILFSGTIIALTTNAIKDYFQKKKSGSGKILLENHIVILNWNNKVPELVSDLLHLENRKVTVMILADIDKEYAEKQIVNATQQIQKTQNELSSLNVLVKKGDPLIRSDLEDISIAKANAILIMSKDMHEEVVKDLPKSDLNVIKIILNLGPIEFEKQPPIVAEVKNIHTKAKIMALESVVHTLHEHTILPICFDRRLGQIIAQTIINPQVEDVYLSLFSFEGSEVYQLPKVDFEQCLANYSQVIPIAKSSEGLYVLSLDDRHLTDQNPTPIPLVPLKIKPEKAVLPQSVYLFGNNNKLQYILDSFSEYEKLYHQEFKAEFIPDDRLAEFVSKLNQETTAATIVLLSDDHQAVDALDANVIDSLIYLEGHLKREGINIIVELLEPKNDHIIRDFNIRNTIISNKIISLLLSKLALYKETAPFYENLLTISINDQGEDEQSLRLVPAREMLNESFPLVFSSKKALILSIYQALGKKAIPIGIFHQGILTLFSGNLSEKNPLSLEEADILVFMNL